MQPIREYLLSYGTLGDFGRFRPTRPITGQRGDRAVARTPRGLELATVLCLAEPGHAAFLPNTTVGEFVRLADTQDEATAARLHERAADLAAGARGLAGELALPVEVLDAEILLDNQHGILQFLGGQPFDARPFVSRLSTQDALHLTLHDLASAPNSADKSQGCGRPGCGRTEGGGCTTCGEGGGCSTCGANGGDVQAHFAALRAQLEQQYRTSLL